MSCLYYSLRNHRAWALIAHSADKRTPNKHLKNKHPNGHFFISYCGPQLPGSNHHSMVTKHLTAFFSANGFFAFVENRNSYNDCWSIAEVKIGTRGDRAQTISDNFILNLWHGFATTKHSSQTPIQTRKETSRHLLRRRSP